MSKFTYQGVNSSMRVAGILFAKGVETALTVEQVKALKADYFGKAFLDDGSLVEAEQAKAEPDTKPVSKMTVPELEFYIIDNGGEFDEEDKKAELLVIAQAIEDGKSAK